MNLGLSLLLWTSLLYAQTQNFFTESEKEFLERARRRDYVALQARKEVASKPAQFFDMLLMHESAETKKALEKSLENAWIERDNIEMEELFFRIIEREIKREREGK